MSPQYIQQPNYNHAFFLIQFYLLLLLRVIERRYRLHSGQVSN